MSPERFRVALVRPDGAARDDADAAIGAANGVVVASTGWDAIDALPAADIVVLRAEGIADDVIAKALARLLATPDIALIVTLAERQIDLIGAFVIGGDAQLLCAPTAVDWAIALAVARGALGTDPGVREGAGERIAQINAEIARIADLLVRLSQQEPPTEAVTERKLGFDAGPDAALAISAIEIRQLIRARRLRDKQFGAGLFEDPAWDMILDLFAARLEGAEVSVSSLCIAAAVAPTTALRWIARLTAAGLFARAPDPFDRRRALMSLSDQAWQGLRSYVATLRALALPLA